MLHRLVSKNSPLRSKHMRSKRAKALGAFGRVVGDNEYGVDVAEACALTSCLAPKEDEVENSGKTKGRAQSRSKWSLLF